jgi:hypothetical protein
MVMPSCDTATFVEPLSHSALSLFVISTLLTVPATLETVQTALEPSPNSTLTAHDELLELHTD